MILKNLAKFFLKKNLRLKNSLENETCYIIGNGQSLKYYDLKYFSNRKAFTINYLHLHNNFNHLDIFIHFFLHPFIFWPVWKMRLDNDSKNKRKYFWNTTNTFIRKYNVLNKDYKLITSLANLPFLANYNNVFYLHHFGKNFDFDFEKMNLHEEFGFINNSLFASIASAYYFGCKKIYLVGMDYLYEEPLVGHFYEKNRCVVVKEKIQEKRLREPFFNYFNKKMKIELISFNNLKSNYVDVISYKDLTGDLEKYKENNELVSQEKLIGLDNLKQGYIVF